MPVSTDQLDDMSVEELAALIAAAETKRQSKLTAARDALIAEFRTKAEALGMPITELFPVARVADRPAGTRSTKGVKLPAKFRGPNGEEWTGKGRTPRWLVALEASGRSRSEFTVS